jgi:uroporphyrinogen decarboxylase
MAGMTHRERVIAALSHEQPDKVPIDLGSTRDSSIVVEGYERLRDHFGIQGEAPLTSQMMRVVDVDEGVLRPLDIDTRGIYPGGPADILIGDARYRDEWGVERVRPADSYYYDQLSFPLAGQISIRNIARYPWPKPDHPARIEGLKDRLQAIRAGGYAAVLNLPSACVHTSQYLRGFEDWFVDIAADRKLITALFDAVLETSLAMCRAILAEVGNDVDVLMGSDDLGVQGGLMVSPTAYRQLIKPRHRRYFQLMRDMSPAKIFFHTCGSVADIIEDLIEIGVDILHPVQVSAKGMDPEGLKKEYGSRLSFWGAIDTQRVLPLGSPDDVRAEVERRIEELGDGGGYVLGAVHNIQPDVPVANILAMYEHARTYVPSFAQGGRS